MTVSFVVANGAEVVLMVDPGVLETGLGVVETGLGVVETGVWVMITGIGVVETVVGVVITGIGVVETGVGVVITWVWVVETGVWVIVGFRACNAATASVLRLILCSRSSAAALAKSNFGMESESLSSDEFSKDNERGPSVSPVL